MLMFYSFTENLHTRFYVLVSSEKLTDILEELNIDLNATVLQLTSKNVKDPILVTANKLKITRYKNFVANYLLHSVFTTSIIVAPESEIHDDAKAILNNQSFAAFPADLKILKPLIYCQIFNSLNTVYPDKFASLRIYSYTFGSSEIKCAAWQRSDLSPLAIFVNALEGYYPKVTDSDKTKIKNQSYSEVGKNALELSIDRTGYCYLTSKTKICTIFEEPFIPCFTLPKVVEKDCTAQVEFKLLNLRYYVNMSTLTSFSEEDLDGDSSHTIEPEKILTPTPLTQKTDTPLPKREPLPLIPNPSPLTTVVSMPPPFTQTKMNMSIVLTEQYIDSLHNRMTKLYDLKTKGCITNETYELLMTRLTQQLKDDMQ